MGKDLNGKELGSGISQRKNGKYCARFQNRFGERKSLYGDTLKEVKNALAKAKADDLRRKNIVDETIILDEWYKKWMDVYKIPVIRLNTKRHYEHIYTTKISPILGRERLNSITKLQVTALLNKLKEQGYQWETLNKVKILLTDMFNRALEDEFLVRNPAKGVRNPRLKPAKRIKALSLEEQNDFLECSTGTFYHNLFLVAINSGLRPGELAALTEADLDFRKNEIHVNKTLLYQKLDGDEKKEFHVEDPKTYTSVRTVPMNAVCKNALLKQIMIHKILLNRTPKELKFPDFIFTTKFCTPLNSQIIIDAIDNIINEINLTRDELDYMEHFSCHNLRHTFATRCFEAGIPPKTVQSYLGHATLEMTMNLYTSVFEQKKQEDIIKLEEYLDIEAPELSQYTQYSNIIKFGT